MKKKTLFIVNPVSGIGRQKKIEKILKDNLNEDLFDYSVRYTERIHHGRDLARQAAEQGSACVVAVGGDGRVNDVASGLWHTDTRLGIIPCGSGNGLARTLKIPLTPALAVRVLNQQFEQTIDAISINDKLMSISAAGVGFDAYIARLMKSAKTRGLPAYTNLIIREYASYTCKDYTLTIDGRTLQRNAWFISIANSCQFGYNFAVAPKAKLDDGLLDISIIDRIPLDHLPISVPLILTNHIELSEHVEMFKAKEIIVEGNLDKWVNIDGEGENVGTTVRFTNHPQSVKIYARNAKSPLKQLEPALQLLKSNIKIK